MGARKSRQSRSVKLEKNLYGLRPVGTRDPLPVVVVVCDDSKTAFAYFRAMKRVVKDKVTIHVIPSATNESMPSQVIDRARRQTPSNEARRSKSTRGRDSVWALIDCEHQPDRQAAATHAKQDAEKHSICVALSKPCFEVWTLLHFVDTGVPSDNCEAVWRRVKKEWQKAFGTEPEKKAQADYSRIMDRRESAAANAKKLRTNDAPAWTEIDLLIEEIEKLRSS